MKIFTFFRGLFKKKKIIFNPSVSTGYINASKKTLDNLPYFKEWIENELKNEIRK